MCADDVANHPTLVACSSEIKFSYGFFYLLSSNLLIQKIGFKGRLYWYRVGCPRNSVDTKFYMFFCTSLPYSLQNCLKFPQNFAEFHVALLDKIVTNSIICFHLYISKTTQLKVSVVQTRPGCSTSLWSIDKSRRSTGSNRHVKEKHVQVQLWCLWWRHVQEQHRFLLSREDQVKLKPHMWCRNVQVQLLGSDTVSAQSCCRMRTIWVIILLTKRWLTFRNGSAELMMCGPYVLWL
jgi:hypothetical protein